MTQQSWRERLRAAQRSGGFLPACRYDEQPVADDEAIARCELLLEAGLYAEAERTLAQLDAAQATRRAEVHVLLARLWLERWDHRPDPKQIIERAKAALDACVQGVPRDVAADAHWIMARVCMQSLQEAVALDHLDAALTLNAEHPTDSPRRLRLELERAASGLMRDGQDVSDRLEATLARVCAVLGPDHAWTVSARVGLAGRRGGLTAPPPVVLEEVVASLERSEGVVSPLLVPVLRRMTGAPDWTTQALRLLTIAESYYPNDLHPAVPGHLAEPVCVGDDSLAAFRSSTACALLWVGEVQAAISTERRALTRAGDGATERRSAHQSVATGLSVMCGLARQKMQQGALAGPPAALFDIEAAIQAEARTSLALREGLPSLQRIDSMRVLVESLLRMRQIEHLTALEPELEVLSRDADKRVSKDAGKLLQRLARAVT